MSYLPYGSTGLGGWVVATGSSVLAHGAVVALAWGGVVQIFALPDAAAQRPEYTITLERLDSDTLAGLLERQATLQPADPDNSARETEAEEFAALTQPAPETETQPVEVAPEETVETPEENEAEPPAEETPAEELVAEQAEALAPETIAADTAATALPLPPESTAALEAVAPEASGLSPVTLPEALVTSPLIAETVVPLGPLSGQGTAATQGAPDGNSGLTAVAPTQTALAPIAPLAGQAAEVVTALDSRAALPPLAAAAAVPPPPPPSAQDIAVGDLIARIRATPADPCLLALPRRDGPEGVGLELVAATDAAMANFAEALLTPEDSAIRQTRTLIDPRQCAALTYLRDNRDYPATRLGIALDASEVPSGAEMSGVLRGVAGRYVLLLIVDNNGVVQDLQRFLSFSGNFARFAVPVTRVGPPRDTSQLLIAITTDRPAATIRARDGQLAEDVFADLDADQGRNAALGFATFDVR